ncbi:MAG: recombinase family protein [Tepidibacter sp.]|jgi:site-specific DNA recombinase|uniref:recombinase family protein n=1 Tax=Tepidibacter sp. TaxID=2529387 RepID=UPI0025DB2EFA|nr:recombinase family protein [Tepidibacter sp.]MCT4510010.1 recombinase family protein [Tepidibacter sp.]
MHNKRLAMYVRVSTEEQAIEGYSIQAQLNKIRQIEELKGNIIVREYIDRGISGKNIENRPELKRLLKDLPSGEFDEVVVWKLNRLSRKQLDLLKIIEEFNKYDIGFRSVTESFDTSTSTGKLMMGFLGILGEFEREQLVENVKMGMTQRAKEGKFNGGVVLGYKSIRLNDNDKQKELIVVEEEAIIVKMIFNMYAQGKGYKHIASKLNKLGYKTKRGKEFSITSIKTVLLNPIYIGKIRFNRYVDYSKKRKKGRQEDFILADGVHEPIIDVDLWEQVQHIFKKRKSKTKRGFTGSYILSGVLKCPACGAPMVSSKTVNKLKDGTRKEIRYYVCGNYKNKGTSVCRSNGIRASVAEEYVLNRLKEVLNKEQILKDIVKNINKIKKEKIKPLEEEQNRLNRELKSIDTKKNKLFSLFEEEIISKQNLSDRLKAIEAEEGTIKVHLEELKKELSYNTSGEITYNRIAETMNKFNELLLKVDNEDKKMLIQMIISKITLTDNKKIDSIELHFNKNLDSLLQSKEGSSNNKEDSSFIDFKIAI